MAIYFEKQQAYIHIMSFKTLNVLKAFVCKGDLFECYIDSYCRYYDSKYSLTITLKINISRFQAVHGVFINQEVVLHFWGFDCSM